MIFFSKFLNSANILSSFRRFCACESSQERYSQKKTKINSRVDRFKDKVQMKPSKAYVESTRPAAVKSCYFFTLCALNKNTRFWLDRAVQSQIVLHLSKYLITFLSNVDTKSFWSWIDPRKISEVGQMTRIKWLEVFQRFSKSNEDFRGYAVYCSLKTNRGGLKLTVPNTKNNKNNITSVYSSWSVVLEMFLKWSHCTRLKASAILRTLKTSLISSY